MDKWKINRVTDTQHNPKEVPQKRLDRTYIVDSLCIDAQAELVCEGGMMLTSWVKYFEMKKDTLVIETENSIYHFERVQEGGF